MRIGEQNELAVLEVLSRRVAYLNQVAVASRISTGAAWNTLRRLESLGQVERAHRASSGGRPRQYWRATRFGVARVKARERQEATA